jgi:hypothetical protein
VPFTFDVHAIIYSENAPQLESELHRKFHNRRLNMKNHKKEFFRVSLDEIAIEVNQKLFSLVISRLDDEYIQKLNDLLSSESVEKRSPYNDLKQLPQRPTRDHLNDLIFHLTWLDSLGEVKGFLKDITLAKIQHFAAEARVLDASEIKDFNQPKRITILISLTGLAHLKPY